MKKSAQTKLTLLLTIIIATLSQDIRLVTEK